MGTKGDQILIDIIYIIRSTEKKIHFAIDTLTISTRDVEKRKETVD